MTLIDTHCHLNMPPLGDDPTAVLERARSRDVTRVIVPAYDLASWPAVLELSGRPDVYAAVGLHPWVADQADAGNAASGSPGGTSLVESSRPGGRNAPRDGLIHQIREAAATPGSRVVAIGEIGLDTKIDQPGLDIQLPVLEAQLQLAEDLDLPVILHCRGAFDELLDAVNNHGGKLRGVLHAFSRSREVADRFLAAGLHLGLGGAVTRPNARKVRRAAAELPLDRIVLETDAPSIGLDGVMPQDTEPQHVADVAWAVAELRGITVEEVALATTTTAGGLFRVL